MNAKSPADGVRTSGLDRVELAVGALLVLSLLYVHTEILRNTGALWRDEVSSVDVATLPTFGEMLRNHHWDSFPVLWCVVLRAWISLGFGESDAGLRALGLVIGVAILVSLWWTARRFGCRAPLVSLALFAASPTVFRFGDAVRGYGLGVLLLIVVVGAMWSLVEQFSTRRALFALVTSVLAVQSLFTNSALLFAVCLAGAAVATRRRAWKTVAWIAAIGVAAVASMLPYLRVFAIHSEWSMIVQTPVDFVWIRDRFGDAVSASGESTIWIWGALAALSAAGCAATIARKSASRREQDLALFAAVTLVAGSACFLAYLERISVPTQVWYYLPILALGALAFEAAVNLLVGASSRGRLLRAGGVVAFALAIAPQIEDSLAPRATTVDVIADHLERRAAADDLIVVYPWYVGITFARYYDGPTPWMIVPDLDTRRFQPYGAFKQRMTEPRPIERELERIATVLRSGHRVWLVGGQQFLQPGEQPRDLPPAPGSAAGWSEPEYTDAWSQQTAHAIQMNASAIVNVPLPSIGPVLWYENLPLVVAEGRR
ncbi:MAG: hypothetical protein K8S98_15695 [Planctomycetes bacterium]|nr:hypothetical protein [Planctomycetota bacterium]